MPRDLAPDLVERLTKAFEADPTARMLQNAVTTTSVDDIALDRGVVTSIDHSFSHLLDDWAATTRRRAAAAGSSPGLNLLRAGAAREAGPQGLRVLAEPHCSSGTSSSGPTTSSRRSSTTADRDVDDRTVAHLLATPGRGRRAVEHVRRPGAKHGLVPKAAMPETKSSEQHAPHEPHPAHDPARRRRVDLRAQAAGGAATRTCVEPRSRCSRSIYRLLCIHLGTPPERFVWQWTDKDRQFHRDGAMTPQRVRGAVRRRCRSTTTSASCTTRARPARTARLHGRVPRQRRRRRPGDLPQRRDRR